MTHTKIRKKGLLSALLVAVMAFTLIQVGTFTASAQMTFITYIDLACADYDATTPLAGEAIPEPTTGTGFPVTTSTTGVDIPQDAAYGSWYVQGQNGWEPAQGEFEEGKTYAFRIDLDGIQAKQGYEFADPITVKVDGIKFDFDSGNPWDSQAGTGWLYSPPVTVKAPPVTTDARVTFHIENGTWDGSDSEDRFVYITLTNGKGTLSASEVPTGMQPNKGFANGKWDVEPSKDTITGEVTYTYTFSPAAQSPAGTQAGAQAPAAGVPSTGDSTDIQLYLAIMLASVVVLGCGFIFKKKANN